MQIKRLRYRIALSFGLLVAITILVSAFAASYFDRLGRSIAEILEESYTSVLAAENMVKLVDRQETAQLEMQVGDRFVAREVFDTSAVRFQDWIDAAQRNTTLPQQPVILDSIQTAYEKYLRASDGLHSLIDQGLTEEASEYHRETVLPLTKSLREHSFRLLRLNEEEMNRTRRQVEAASRRATQMMFLAALGAAILSLYIAWRIVKLVVVPIDRLTSSVRLIAQGQLKQRVEVATDDEIGELSREFNKMTERLQSFEDMNVQQLIAEKKKSETVVAAMPNPVIVTDADDRVLLLNEAARNVLDVQHLDWKHRPLPEVMADEAMAGRLAAPEKDPESDPLLAIGSNGQTRYYRRRQTAILDPEGQVVQKVYLLEDVTQFKELDQMKSDFLAAVSHELRTPLTSLGMALDIVLQQVAGPVSEMQKDLLEAAREDNERLKRLVKGLLDLARLESGTYQQIQEPVNLTQVVLEALGPLHLPFREKGVRLDYRIDPGLPTFQGDSQQLGWAVTNLVSNALRFTPTGGKVTVKAEERDDTISVSVTDTGRGIPPESVSHIFDKFVQLKSQGESTPGSIGLGLAIAREVVEVHGGKIWVESVMGEGSTFRFVIPVSPGSLNGR